MATKITMADLRAVEKVSSLAMAELLRRAFDLVAPQENWKAPINKVLYTDALAFEEDVIREAIIFMTGSVPSFDYGVKSQGFAVRVRAAGYYAVCGS